MQKRLEFVFLVRLSGIIGGPFLRVRLALRFRDGNNLRDGFAAVRVIFHFFGELNGEHMLANHTARFVVHTTATWRPVVSFDGIAPVAGLGRNHPYPALFLDGTSLKDCQSTFFASVHRSRLSFYMAARLEWSSLGCNLANRPVVVAPKSLAR